VSVVVGGTNASSPSAEKSIFSVCAPTMPRSVPLPLFSSTGACSSSMRPSWPSLAKRVPTAPPPSTSAWR
jgi:hypothetical protein